MDDITLGAVANTDKFDDVHAATKSGDAETSPRGSSEGREAEAGSRAVSNVEGGHAASDSAPGSYFPPPPETPTQLDACGIRFDFNDGCRVRAAVGPDIWRIRLLDLDTGNLLFQTTPEFRGGTVLSAKKYFVRFRIEAWKAERLVFRA